jgi:hypothetical protein
VVVGRAVGDTREDLKHSPNRRKKDYSIPLEYYDSRDSKRVIKKRDYRENKEGRRRYTGESPDRRGKKIKERRSSSLYK